MGQDIFDLVIVVTLVFFTLRGIGNGFIGEAAGILSLVGGFWAARTFSGQLSPHLDFISDPSLRYVAACAILFIGVMLAIGLVARILQKVIALSFAAWADRLGGALLGLAKGILLWAIIIVLLEKLFRDAPFMRDSRVLPYLGAIIDQLKQWLPPQLAEHI